MRSAATRACARLAWRQARRSPGRAGLVVAMIAFPVAALTLGATLIRTTVPTVEEHVTGTMGSAELKLHPPFTIQPTAVEAVLPDGSRVVSVRQWNHTMVLNGSLVFASVFEPSVLIDRPPIRGLYELVEGRVPTQPGEAALDPKALETWDVSIGDQLVLGERQFRVVGVAVRPRYMYEALMVAAPGTLTTASNPQASLEDEVNIDTYLVDLPSDADVGAAKESIREYLGAIAERSGDPSWVEQVRSDFEGGAITTREAEGLTLIDDKARLTGVSFVGTTLALFATGLVTAAAFAVGIRRQLRMLGLVGAAGGERRHVRAVVLLSGTTLGAAGSAVGIVVGLAAAYAATPHLPRFTHALPGPVVVHLPTLLGAGALGMVAATLAAAWPARIAARISTLDALATRMPVPRAPGRLARTGVLVAGLGALLTGVVFKPGDNEVIFTLGLVLMIAGFMVSIPWLLTAIARAAKLVPVASRLAIRDTARHGRRTGSAIAAAAIALTTPVAVAALSLSEEANSRRTPVMGDQHMLIGNQLSDTMGRPKELPAAMRAEILRALPGAIVSELHGALLDLERYPPLGTKPAFQDAFTEWVAYAEGPEIALDDAESGGMVTGIPSDPAKTGGEAAFSYRRSAGIVIGDADLLRALGAESGIAALKAGKIVGIGPGTTDEGAVRILRVSYDGEPPRILAPAVEAGSTSYPGELLPTYVVSEAGARAIGLLRGPPPYFFALVAAPSALIDDQIDAVKDVVARYEGGYVQTLQDFLPHFRTARLAAIAGAVVIALGVVGIIVALLGAEAQRDQAILVAIGGGGRARRRIAGARAGIVALLAAVVALPTGFAPVAIVQWSRPEKFPIVVPWTTMAIVVVAVPLVAAGFGWLTSRAPSSSAMLRPVE